MPDSAFKKSGSPAWISSKSLAAGLIALLLCSIGAYAAITGQQKNQDLAMERLILEKSMKINEVISKLLYKTQAVAGLAIQNDGLIVDFAKTAAVIVDDPAILNVLIARGGVVNDVYPKEGNEGVIGLDFFNEGAGNKEARLAKDKEQLVFGGPFPLRQGGLGLVGRLPVWLPNGPEGQRYFWGMVSVTLKYPEALEGVDLDSLTQQGFVYEIWRINPDDGQKQIIAGPSGQGHDLRFIEVPVPILNAEWFFRLASTEKWFERPETWFLILTSLVLSFLVTLITQNNLNLRSMRDGLERLVTVEPLTGTLNRIGFFQRLERLTGEAGGFVLYYLDLNYFKQANDRYGHGAGDIILIEFSRRIRMHLGERDLIARIGGDDFVVVLCGLSAEQRDAFWRTVDEEFQTPIRLSASEDLFLSFSRGEAAYPAESRGPDELISVADGRMFQQKRARYAKEQRRRRTDWAVENA